MRAGNRLLSVSVRSAMLLLGALMLACAPGAQPAGSAPPAKPAAANAPATQSAPPGGAPAPPLIKVTTGTLSIPGVISSVTSVLRGRDFATKHGLELEIKDYSTIAAVSGAYVTGEVQMGVTGPHVLQRMRNDGVPLQMLSTFARLDGVRVLTADPRIADVPDLKGKRIAADLASSEYNVFLLYAKKMKGLDLRSDATVVNAALPLARQQLKTGEADAAVLWEPVVAQALIEDNPDYRSMFDGQKAWREMTNTDGWELVGLINQEFARQNPGVGERVIAMMQDAVKFINDNPDEAAIMVEREIKIPARVFREAIVSGRMVLMVEPAWESPNRQALEEMFKAAVEIGLLDRLPPSEIFYQPR